MDTVDTPQWRIVRYEPSMAATWNDFVARSRNGTFLFDRGYMDYHADRFADCSWMAFKGNRLLAVLPADITADATLRSHGGLTYGGWVTAMAHLDAAGLLGIFTAACDVWRAEGISRLDYKPVPYIYSRKPSQDDLYALFRLGAVQTECAVSSTIDLSVPVEFNQQMRRHLAQASRLPIETGETDDVGMFMTMLADCLRERHDTRPVHTAAELRLLKDRFPDNIRLFVTTLEGVPHAAVCVYDTGVTAHAQYIATTAEGRRLNLLTPLFDYLIREVFARRRWFDFGISTEDHGRTLNAGLLRQKTSYGAGATVYTRWRLDL